MTDISITDLHRIRDAGNRPRVHPNGFVQLDIDDKCRLHLWHPALPYRQKTYHPIHDHVFGFKSECIVGRLVHVHYEMMPIHRLPAEWNDRQDHVLWQAVCLGAEDTILEKVDELRMRPVAYRPIAITAGNWYSFGAFEFHETLCNIPTITVIKKDGPTLQQGATRSPRIAVPVGVEPDNEFRRDDVSEDLLWSLIYRTIQNG